MIEALAPDSAAFALERHGPCNLHICGEAFSDYQGFIEGALRTADVAMGKIFAQGL